MDAKKVLVVDDEPSITEVLSYQFGTLGMEAVEVNSVSEAEKKLEDSSFDLISLDINMPGKDGITFAEDLRRQGNQTPIVFVTAFVNERNKSRIKVIKNVLSVVPKPCDWNRMEKVLTNLL